MINCIPRNETEEDTPHFEAKHCFFNAWCIVTWLARVNMSHSSSVFPASSLNQRETDVPRGKPPASIQFSCQFQQPWEFYGEPWGYSLFPHLLRALSDHCVSFRKIAQREVTFYIWRFISIHRLRCWVYGLQMINTFTDSSPGEYPQGLKCVMHSRHSSDSYPPRSTLISHALL